MIEMKTVGKVTAGAALGIVENRLLERVYSFPVWGIDLVKVGVGLAQSIAAYKFLEPGDVRDIALVGGGTMIAEEVAKKIMSFLQPQAGARLTIAPKPVSPAPTQKPAYI